MPIKKRPTRKSASRRKATEERELEKLVRDGVEEFMLRDATIYDFVSMIRSAGKQIPVAPHPLTQAVFSRIVKAAVKKRREVASVKESRTATRKAAKPTKRRKR